MRRYLLILLSLILLLSSCQLANDTKNDTIVIGALFRFDNPWADQTSYEKIYAKKIAYETDYGQSYRFEFDQPGGRLQGLYRQLDPVDPMEDVVMGLGIPGETIMSYFDDRPSELITRATHYYSDTISQQQIYLFKVYQDNSGQVFIDPSPPYFQLPITGGGIREYNAMNFGQRVVENQLQLHANFEAIYYPDQLTVSQFDGADEVIDRRSYPVDDPPEEIKLLPQAKYLLLSYETKDGLSKRRQLITADESEVSWPKLQDSGFIEMELVRLSKAEK